MLLISLKKIGSKWLVGVANLCKGGVSQLNVDSYNPRGGQRCHIHSHESTNSINQNC
jgi:hypothetical protein